MAWIAGDRQRKNIVDSDQVVYMKRLRARKAGFVFRVVLAVLIALLAGLIVTSKYGLSVGRFSVKANGITAPIRIVQLTDLHNSEFGDHNGRLIRKVAAQEPDLILITGDLLNQNEERTDIAEELIAGLSDIAPVYVSFGNHEVGYEKNYGTNLRAVYTAAGATVLEFDWQDVEVNGQALRLGGLYGYCLPAKYVQPGNEREPESIFLSEFQDTDRYTVLLCHMPASWIQYGSLEWWNVDCILSGHVHGGQMRLPWIGGLWAPDQGWFPGRECGLYWSKDGQRVMVLSRGLGNTERLPRINNIPEILVLDLLPAD